MLTSVLSICLYKTKDFVPRYIRIKKLLCLGTQSLCSTNSFTQKNCKECFYVQILCFNVAKLFLYFVSSGDVLYFIAPKRRRKDNDDNNNNNNNNNNDYNNNNNNSDINTR